MTSLGLGFGAVVGGGFGFGAQDRLFGDGGVFGEQPRTAHGLKGLGGGVHGDMIALEPYLDLVVVMGALGVFGLSATEDPLGSIGRAEVDDLSGSGTDALFEGSAPAKTACVDAESGTACCEGSAHPFLEMVGVAEKDRTEGEAVDLAPPPAVGFGTHAFFEILVSSDKSVLDGLISICGEPKIRATKDRLDRGFKLVRYLKPAPIERFSHRGFVVLLHELELEGRKDRGRDAFGADAPVPFEKQIDLFTDLGGESCAHLKGFECALEEVSTPKTISIALQASHFFNTDFLLSDESQE